MPLRTSRRWQGALQRLFSLHILPLTHLGDQPAPGAGRWHSNAVTLQPSSARGLQGQLAALRLEQVVEAILRELDAGREPQASGRPHVMKDAAQRERPTRPTDDVRMHRERDVFRALRAALRIELVEIGLPGLEPVIRIAVFAMAVAEQGAVA